MLLEMVIFWKWLYYLGILSCEVAKNCVNDSVGWVTECRKPCLEMFNVFEQRGSGTYRGEKCVNVVMYVGD